MSLVKKTAEEIRELKRQKEERRYDSIKIIVIFNVSNITFISRMRNMRFTGNSEVQGKRCPFDHGQYTLPLRYFQPFINHASVLLNFFDI